MNFTILKGTFRITLRHETKWNNKRNMNAGFNCSIKLNSPHKLFGLERLLRKTIISADELGMTPSYDLTPILYTPFLFLFYFIGGAGGGGGGE